MSKPIFTALSPNTERDDVLLAFKLLFRPWRWKNGAHLSLLKKEFQDWLSSKHVFFFESGRTSLYAILNVLDLKNDDEVLLQAYTCIAVPEPILWVGAKPVYVDCDEETFNMSVVDLEKKITAKSKVLIIQHTFGYPADLGKLLEIAKKHNLFVIEDCAHALGSTYEDKLVGTFGDASFFSFGRDKVISAVFGGVVSVKNPQIAAKIEAFWGICPLPSSGWIFHQLLHPVIMAFVKLTFNIYIGKIVQHLALRFGILSKAVYREERKGLKPPFIFKQFPNALAVLALKQFRKLDKFNQHRQEIAGIYKSDLSHLQAQKELNNSRSIYLRYTIHMLHAHKILKSAAKHKIFLGDWYTTSLAPEGVDYEKMQYTPSTCPVAEKLARETFNLPTNIQITKNEAEKIISFVKNYVTSNPNN
jgi:dTDP-4-amino-4,6-dideoxygalactose transaminase